MNDLEIIYKIRQRINNLEGKLKILKCENVQNNIETNKRTISKINKIESRLIKLKGIQNDYIYNVYSNVNHRPKSRLNLFDINFKINEIFIEDNITNIKLTPKSFKCIDKNKLLKDIIYPNDGTDRNLINLISIYRSFINKSNDFSHQPIEISEDSIETLIILFKNLIDQYNGEIIINNELISYSDTFDYILYGISNLSNIHLITSNIIKTAIFSIKFNLNYDKDLTQSYLIIKNFIFDLIKSISNILQCKYDFIRIFSIEKISNKHQLIKINFGITTPDQSQTEYLARHFQTLVCRSDFRNDKILRHIQSDRYQYELKTQLNYFQISTKDFQQNKFDQSFNTINGWFYHKINVNNKYLDKSLWYSNDKLNSIWPIGYYGINQISSINLIKNDLNLDENNIQSNIYVTNNLIDDIYNKYAKSIKISNGNNYDLFKIVFQCRVKPNSFIIEKYLSNNDQLWKINDPKAIRPFGLLIKREKFI